MAEKKDTQPAVLTEVEAQSPLWKKIKAHLEQRTSQLREANDANLDPAKTNILRGRIKESKYLAALDTPAPQTEADDNFSD